MENSMHRHFGVQTFAESQCLVYSRLMGLETDQKFMIDRMFCDDYLVMHTLRGTLIVEQYGKTFRIPQGQSIILTLHDPHKYYFSQEEDTAIQWFHFNGFPAEKLMDTLRKAELLPCIACTPNMKAEMERLLEIKTSESPWRDTESSALIYRLLLETLREPLAALENSCNPMPPFRRQFTRFIRDHITCKFTLEMLAREAGMSKSKFCAEFRREFGMTAFSYIEQVKIEVGKQFLLLTNDPISEISAYLGFHDQSHFSNVFRRLTGTTPLHFRTSLELEQIRIANPASRICGSDELTRSQRAGQID